MQVVLILYIYCTVQKSLTCLMLQNTFLNYILQFKKKFHFLCFRIKGKYFNKIRKKKFYVNKTKSHTLVMNVSLKSISCNLEILISINAIHHTNSSSAHF